MSKVLDRIKEVDLYQLLNIEPDADQKTIKKAYRKRALDCHPDKNPDNPKAAEEFHQLSDAYEILTDENAKKAYDNLLKSRKANELRNRQLDAKRRKLKDDLEARERAAQLNQEFNQKSEKERLKAELERLSREGSRLLEEEQEKMRKEIAEEKLRREQAASAKTSNEDQGIFVLKLKWKESTEEYDEDRLRTIFHKYGDVANVVFKRKEKKCTALIEIQTKSAAINAARMKKDKFKITVLDTNGQEVDVNNAAFSGQNTSGSCSDSLVTDLDFESVVMNNLRRAEARKREIERLKEEDAKESVDA